MKKILIMMIMNMILISVLGGAEFYVSNDGNNDNDGSESHPYETIQHAVNQALRLTGGMVDIKIISGNYAPFTIDEQESNIGTLTIIGIDGANNCVIDANLAETSGPNKVTLLHCFDVFLVDLSFTNSDNNLDTNAISILSSNRCFIDQCIIDGFNFEYSGAGIYIDEYSGGLVPITIRNSSIRFNTSGQNGGGIYSMGWVVIENCNVNNNQSLKYGGGIYLSTKGNSNVARTISNSFIGSNQSARGAGICVAYQDASGIFIVQGNTITRNIASNTTAGSDYLTAEGGGIRCTNNTSLLDNVIKLNSSEDQGGGVHLGGIWSTTEYYLEGNQIYANDADEGAGITGNTGQIHLASCNITDNTATSIEGGGGINFAENLNNDGSNFLIENTILYDNTAADLPNQIVYENNEDDENHNELLSIKYSCIENIEISNPLASYIGNIYQYPEFTYIDENNPDNSNYQLTVYSPCIDTGDPNHALDPDGTQFDMGANYFNHNWDIHRIEPGYNWISFPRNTTTTPDAETANIIPILQNIDGFDLLSNMELYYLSDTTPLVSYYGGSWYNSHLDNKTMAYKLTTSATETQVLTVAGEPLSATHAIDETLDANEYHWIGYWLPRTQNIKDAFGSGTNNDFWSQVEAVKAENWYFDRQTTIRGAIKPTQTTDDKFLVYGKGYLIKFKNDVTNFQWHDSQNTSVPITFKQTDNFEYEEKADYETIDLLNIPAGVDEIGVFENGICLGAVVVQDSAEQVLVYSEAANRAAGDFTFEFYTGDRSSERIKKYEVLDLQAGKYEARPLTAGRNEYSVVRFQADSAEDQTEETPLKVKLFNNYPNPFNPTTEISFDLPQTAQVKLEVYNLKGQKVKTLANSKMDKGTHSVIWQGKDNHNKPVASGIYLYKITAGEEKISKRMLLLK